MNILGRRMVGAVTLERSIPRTEPVEGLVCALEPKVRQSWLSHQPPEGKAESQPYLSEKVATQEKEIIEAALQECQGRVSGPSGAAAKLGIARSTLESKIRSLKINKNRFRA